MPFPHTIRPFKSRSRRGIPSYVAVLAMVLLAFTLPADFGFDGERAGHAKADKAAPASEPVNQVKHKINIRLSLFRHG